MRNEFLLSLVIINFIYKQIPYIRWSNAFMFSAISCYLFEDYGK